MSDTFLVTGATGFVGSCLVRELIRQQKSVAIIVRNKELNWRLRDLSKNLMIYNLDLLDRNLESVIGEIKPSYIFHLAAYGAVPGQFDQEKLIDVNIKGTLRLINAVKKNKFKLFINTGSSSEYGVKQTSISETDNTIPINDYGVTKVAGTLFCQKVAIRDNLPIVTFRLFSPYGPYELSERLVPYVVLQSLKNKPMHVSSPHNVRDFIYIGDVVKAYILALNKQLKPGDIYNISTGKQHSVQQIIDTVSAITGNKTRILWNKVTREVQIEPARWEGKNKKAKIEFGWRPETSLENGLRETVAWFRDHKNLYN